MDIHWIQHVVFEGLGSNAQWAEAHGHDLIRIRLWAGEELPDLDTVRMLVVMGGPMGVHDDVLYPWLSREKQFVSRIIAQGGTVLGICLGAQLIANVLAADVMPNREKEIGWFPVERSGQLEVSQEEVFPERMTVFHWHGDTFALPAEAVRLYSSSACHNQAFLYRERVLGLQFHLEMTEAGVKDIVDNCRDELLPSLWVQSEQEIFETKDYMPGRHKNMSDILEYLIRKTR